LVHAETVLALPVPSGASLGTGLTVPAVLRQNREVDRLARDLHALELALTVRLLQARTCAVDAKRQDSTLAAISQLIHAGTAVIADVAVDAADGPRFSFDTGGGATAFLASRGAIAGPLIALNEDYLVNGGLPLGLLMDFCATALDKIDLALDQAARAMV
jgi:hypothetical protein